MNNRIDKSLNYILYAITLIAVGAICLNIFVLSVSAQAQSPEKTPSFLSGESSEALSGNATGGDSIPEYGVENNSDSETAYFGLRKIFAPESQIRRWPLGGKKYRFINSRAYNSAIELWRRQQKDGTNSNNAFFDSGTLDAYIESATYQGVLSSTGELSGTGEWTIRINPFDATEQAEQTLEGKTVYRTTLNTPFTHFLVPPTMQMLVSDFSFVSKNRKTNPAENADEEKQDGFSWNNLIVGCLPSGQTVIFVPSDGVIHFRWTAPRQAVNDYLLQNAPSMNTVWTLDIPSDRKLTLRDLKLDSTNLRYARVDCPTTPVDSTDSDKEESATKPSQTRYSFRWSGTETALISLVPAEIGIEKSDCPYQQQTTYYFSSSQLRTRSKITFIPGLTTTLPKEIPFKTVNDSHAIWDASYDGQPVEIRTTDSGFNIILGKVQPKNREPVLQISSNMNLESLLDEKSGMTNTDKDRALKLSVPRVELLTGHWESGTALFYTSQMPLQFNSGSSKITETKTDVRRRYQTTLEMTSKEEEVEITLKPFQERFFSQDDTTLQWDGSQISFQSRIYLWAEQGNRYVLTAPLPEHLAIDHVEFLDKTNMLEDWEVQIDSNNPLKRTLIIYLRESIRSDRSFSLEIHSHTITAWDKAVLLDTLQPIRFDGFEPHAQTLLFQIPLNQRFWVADRILYSPGQNKEAPFSETLSAMEENILPRGIEMTPLLSKEGTLDSRSVIGAEFRIDLQKWGKSLSKLEPEDNGFSLDTTIVIVAEEKQIKENVHLRFKGDCSRLSQFRFSCKSRLDNSSSEASKEQKENISPWKCTLETPVNQYVLKVSTAEDGTFCVNLPTSVSAPFSMRLERALIWNQQYSTALFQPEGCRQMTAKVNLYSSIPKMLDIQANNLHPLITRDMEFINKIIRQYTYTLKPDLDKHNASDTKTAELLIKRLADNKDAQTIWAWNERVEEYHFGSGNVQTSAQWTIENRFPPVSSKRDSEHVKQYIHLQLPEVENVSGDTSKSSASLTGLWIDGVLVGGENIRIESDGSFSILLPLQKKLFVMTVQWTCKQSALKTSNSFSPQQPSLDIPVFHNSWNVYYPTSYRRWNSFASSDASVDGFFQRWFGPLIRRDSDSLYNVISQIWESGQKGNNSGRPDSDNTDTKKSSRDSSGLSSIIAPSNSRKNSTIDHLDNSLSSRESWNCCSIEGKSRLSSICIVRNDVCECFRWTVFICTVCLIFTFYKKRIQFNESLTGSVLSKSRIRVKNAPERIKTESKIETVTKSTSVQSVIREAAPENTDSQRLRGSTLERITTQDLSVSKRLGMRVKSWGFRRWLAIICISSAFLAQVLPWVTSLLFSGLFTGTLLGLLVLARSVGAGKSDSSSFAFSSSPSPRSGMINGSLKSMFSYMIICVFIFLALVNNSNAQQPENDYWDDYHPLSVTDPPFIAETETTNIPSAAATTLPAQPSLAPEYQVFIPVDEQSIPMNTYYVPQELYEALQSVERRTQNYPWVVCRANYYGKLVQQLYKTETSAWRVVLEIETFFPNVSVQLPQRMQDTTYASSNITIRRGLPSYFPGVKEDEALTKKVNSPNPDSTVMNTVPSSKDTASNNSGETTIEAKRPEIHWVWDAAKKISPQWNAQDERWILKITQPGRYQIETVFHPTIISEDGKNEISFAVLPCINSTLEIESPDNISELEFPGALGSPQDLTRDTATDSLSTTSESRKKVKFVPLGAIDQVVVRWNQGGILSGGPTYDVDTLFWWTVAPERAVLKVKYRMKVSSGEVPSLKIKTDPRLTVLASGQEISGTSFSTGTVLESESVNDQSDSRNVTQDNQQDNASRRKLSETHRRDSVLVSPPSSVLSNPLITDKAGDLKSNIQSFDSQSPIASIVQNLENRNEYTVIFKSPIRDQVSFEMNFIWENAVGVGSPQFPTIMLPEGHAGRRLAAFSLDSRLQCDWSDVSTSLTSIPIQTFVDLWGASARQGIETPSNAGISPIIPLPPPPGSELTTLTTDPVSPLEGTAPGDALSRNQLLNPRITKDNSTDAQNLPAAVFDLNMSKGKSDTADFSESFCLNIQRVPFSAKGTAEAFLLAQQNRIRWQILWNLDSVKGEKSTCSISLSKLHEKEAQNWIISSAAVKTDTQYYYASVYKKGDSIDIYWGTPVDRPCQIVLTGEIQLPSSEEKDSTETKKTRFVFPTLDTVEISQYKLALSRGDEVSAELEFEPPTSSQTAFSPIGLPIDSPFSVRCQRVVGAWQTVGSDTNLDPVGLFINSKNNIVQATISYSMTVSLENPPVISMTGNVQSISGILDEIVFETPDYYGTPVSQRSTINCIPDLNSISTNKFILRSASPFTVGSSFHLTIPLKASDSDEWVISDIRFDNISAKETLVQLPPQRKDVPIQWHLEELVPVSGIASSEPVRTAGSVVKTGVSEVPGGKTDSSAPATKIELKSYKAPKSTFLATGYISSASEKWTQRFGVSVFINPVSDSKYYAAAQFAAAVSGNCSITVEMPQNTEVVDVQVSQKSVNWRYDTKKNVIIPLFSEKEPENIRIIYRGSLSRSLYSEPMVFNPPNVLDSIHSGSVTWIIRPWKNFNKITSRVTHLFSHVQYEIGKMEDLLAQMRFVQSLKGGVSKVAIERFQTSFRQIEKAIKQGEIDNQVAQASNGRRIASGSPSSSVQNLINQWQKLSYEYNSLISVLSDNKDSDHIGTNETSSITASDSPNTAIIPSVPDFSMILNPTSDSVLIVYGENQLPISLEINLQPRMYLSYPLLWVAAFVLLVLYFWLVFFPPESFLHWRTTLVMGSLGLVWLVWFNLYPVALALLIITGIGILKHVRRLAHREIVPLRVR